MIVKRNFHPLKVWGYIQRPMLFIISWSLLVWAGSELWPKGLFALNFAPVAVFGSALAIFVAFRNNSAYARWWEARQIWGGIVNSSRVFARLAITFADSHSQQANFDPERTEAFKQAVVKACIAWVNALRLQLRGQDEWDELLPFLSANDFEAVKRAQNKPNHLHMIIARKIYEAMANGTLGGFDSFQMEGQLLALANYQGGAERIKNTPLPRQYDFFTRIFVFIFSLLLPFGMLGLFQSPEMKPFAWVAVPLSILIGGVFVIMEKTGAANENPFENKITDVPMTALCITIERDLREMLGEEALPPSLKPKDGYLY
jgi:putative membrane protein